MPVNAQFDFVLNNLGYMLSRDKTLGRSWLRRGTSDLPRRSFLYEEGRFGHQPDEIDHAEVWEDFSGEFGRAYRPTRDDNGILFSRDMDCRFPRQMIHCQALQLLPNAQYSGSNINVDYMADVPLTGAAGSAPAGAGALLAYGQNFISSFTPTNLLTIGSMFDKKAEATGASFAGRPATFGSYTYVPVSSGNYFQRGFDGATYTQGPNPGQVLANAGNRMWVFAAAGGQGGYLRSVANGADPLVAANLSATLLIGNGLYRVGDMAERGDQLYLGMPDGLYVGDQSGSFFNVLPEARDLRHVDNGRDLDIYDGGVIYGGQPGTFWFQASQFGGQRGDAFEVGARGILSNRSPVRGRPRVNETYGPWLYQGLWTGSESYILGGRREGQRQENYIWRVLQRLPHTAKIHRLHFDGITNASGRYTEIPTRMWVATEASFGAQTGATAPLYAVPIPRLNENPLSDLTFTPNYNGSARVDLPYTDWGMPGVPKVFRALEITADFLLSGAQYADVWYTIDSGNRQYLGRAQTSPKSTLLFPGDNGTFVSGQACQLSIESYTFSQMVSPVYRTVVMRGAVRPNAIDVISAIVRAGDGVRDRLQMQLRDGATMLSELRAMSRQSNPVQLIDLAGAAQWCIVLPSIEEQESYQQGSDFPEVAATVRMAVLNFTNSVGPPIALEPIFQMAGLGGLPM